MRSPATPASLVVVTADRMMKAAIETLLRARTGELGIRRMSFLVLRHHEADPGCRTNSVEVARGHIRDSRHLLVLFDYDGCGSREPPGQIEKKVEEDLARNGWKGRSKVIVIVPELESWIWGRSEGAARALHWRRGFPALRAWLAAEGLWPAGDPKPPDPKAAAERVLEEEDEDLTAEFYRDLAAYADFRDCRDPAFRRLRDTLREWYPARGESPGESGARSPGESPGKTSSESAPES